MADSRIATSGNTGLEGFVDVPSLSPLPVSTLFSSNESTDRYFDGLSRSQQVQLTAALSYYALLNPGATIEATIAVGNISQVPALTDVSTRDGSAIGPTSTSTPVSVKSTATGDATAQIVQCQLRLAHPDASPATTRPPEGASFPRKVYRELEKRAPLLLDRIREVIITRREKQTLRPLPRFPSSQHDVTLLENISHGKTTPGPTPKSRPQAVLFGLHWLQTGGAERWAIESIQMAKEAGFLPVVVTDQNSVHPWAVRPELEGCVVLMLSSSPRDTEPDIRFAEALLSNFNLVGVVLHHSMYLYQMLPLLKQNRPTLPVVDSLHIVEYLGGGYPGTAVSFDEFIDTHHVISPQLVEWMGNLQGVPSDKLELAPLSTLTTSDIPPTQEVKNRRNRSQLTIAFVGRLSRQKRPDAFLGLVKRLHKDGLLFRAILHGDGEMRGIVTGLINKMGLADIIEQRFEDVPVARTFSESDLLVITSINEGLTLTTFEAVAAGIPVISTDVGSQRTVVQGEALFPRPAGQFIAGASTLIRRMTRDEGLREEIWAGQRDRITEFSALPTAHNWMKEQFAAWQE